ncbi:tripartite tricarboxylate transporter substrate binding protein [Pantoea sp. 18069]|uniref:Bug family tripartite tricarboxylate transporter substrate binding protein n=1 Tax=Pantoea sp. 18069 TaxID=2681415 RepID=UPI00135C6DB7|nr:tripartite tricarboxylate transporter substrate-binding protein [Pantoea sp. 18069]
MLIRHLRLGLAAIFAIFCAVAAQAQPVQSFPTKPVQIIVPYAAGGVTDILARIVAQRLSERWKQPVIVDNRPGAGTVIGTAAAAKAPGDGHTLLITAFGFTANQVLVPKLPYKPAALAPLAMLADSYSYLYVNAAVPANTVPELIAYAKAHPGMTFASSGNGSSPHIAAEGFAGRTGIDIVHVPYKGNGPAINDLVGGQVQALFDSSATMSFVQTGKLKVLGIGSTAPIKRSPDIVPIAKSGVPALADFTASGWFGMFVPSSTPQALQKKIHADVQAVLETKDMHDAIYKTGLEPALMTQQGFADYLKKTLATWAPVIRERKIRLD